MRLKYEHQYSVLFTVLSVSQYSVHAISNTQFNANIREFGSSDDNSNLTHLQIKTLQKEESGKHASFGPARNTVSFKEIPDDAVPSSSHSRGLLHRDHGYATADYEEFPNYGYGYQYPAQLPDKYNPHGIEGYYEHHDSGLYHHSGPQHLDYGHHYKHALAAKSLLWPIAGIALLGAAAAFVSNPVLLQLGVVSGKRRRRDTDIVSGPDLNMNPYDTQMKNSTLKKSVAVNNGNQNATFDQRMFRWNLFKNAKHGVRIASTNISTFSTKAKTDNLNKDNDDNRYIPVPLQIKHS